MKLIYEAQNSVEAHMILDLLEQAGLSARIDGEYLQGGVGELQAMGLVRVMVDEEDYLEAKQIVQEWDEKQPAEEKQTPIKKTNRFGGGILGFVLGIVVMGVYYNTPITEDGIDYNGDSKLDEKWTVVNHRITKIQYDRNFDGKIDSITSFDQKGLIKSLSADEDFNGVFETQIHYYLGNPVWQESDTTGDGFNDYRIDFKHGIAKTVTFFDPTSKKAIKVQEYGPFKLESAEVDTTQDGILDAHYQYDSNEEISKEFSR